MGIGIVNHRLTQEDIDRVLLRCLEYGAKDQRYGFYVPSSLIMYVTQGLPPAAWEDAYSHESAHSILTDSWLGWTIQALDDLSSNLFIAVKNEIGAPQELASWIMNVEYKKRKLCETWLQTQEGLALYFQLDLLNLEERSIALAKSLCEIRGRSLTEEDEKRIRQESKRLRERIAEIVKAKKCKDYYWKGYEKILQISKNFGQELVAPSVLVACSIKLPLVFLEKTPAEFDVMVESVKYNADKRLDVITKIPFKKVSKDDKKDQLSFLKFLFNYFNEEIEIEIDLYDYIEKLFSHKCLPKSFREKFLPAYISQEEKVKARWKRLKKRGYDPSQIISLINAAGKLVAISDFEPVSTPETEEILEISYSKLFASLEKCSFINELIDEMSREKGIEEWMFSIAGFGELTEIKSLLPESILLSKGRICPICSSDINYQNYLLECPYSGILCCMKCCEALDCPGKCKGFEDADKKVARIMKAIKEFKYAIIRQSR